MTDSAFKERPSRSLFIAAAVAVVCALLVSIAAVGLKPRYHANLEAERLGRLSAILEALEDSYGSVDIGDIETRVINLSEGKYNDSIDAALFDPQRAARDPARSILIPDAHDLAGLNRRANHAVVYLVPRAAQEVPLVLLPVSGVGYQSVLQGYVAFDAATGRIQALRFYDHGETPGLGSRIQDPEWENSWPGKRVFGEDGTIIITVGSQPGLHEEFQVDAISGATRTSLGVQGLIRFWLGDYGFGPYLERLRRGEI